eukprot:3740666-Ditylum_brightwellii.AAC.1
MVSAITNMQNSSWKKNPDKAQFWEKLSKQMVEQETAVQEQERDEAKSKILFALESLMVANKQSKENSLTKEIDKLVQKSQEMEQKSMELEEW